MENASTVSIIEKYRQDKKREIKRLQRLREFFRSNVNNPAVTEPHRLVEARRRIEAEMEKFRDHMREYKSNRPTKATMLNDTEMRGKFVDGSGSEFDDSYGEEEGSEDEGFDDNETPDILLDRRWLTAFIQETLRSIIERYDNE